MTDLYHAAHSTHAMIPLRDMPRECTACHRMSHWFVNTGWTRCIGCKIEEEIQDGTNHCR